ncbi:siderophore-interacting protein [Agromyces allii]|uniref:Siderophore-interacting protein n=2 Tax=Agromyces allii TaxID=393607 RepID=A0ABN2Q0Q0_9MICO
MTDAATARTRPTSPAARGASDARRAPADPASPFFRAGGRLRFTAREVVVSAVSRPVDEYVRVTFSGADLADFESNGPTDHVRVFFPDPATGELVAPVAAGPGEDGIVRPDGPVVSRDFTPLAPRTDTATGARSFDLDFLLHDDPGPAASWGAAAKVGDRLVVVGPRGSKAAPQNAARVLCVVDGTSLPAAGRWLAEVPATTAVEVVFDDSAAEAEGDLVWVRTYLRGASGREASVRSSSGDLADEVLRLGVDAGTFVFAAGEASRLVGLRRLLKAELRLPRDQYALSGYWKRGTVGFDHHAPIDPDDLED